MIEYINQTLINTWAMCPERVRRRWFLGDIIPPGIAARIGTGVHKGAEVNHKAKVNTGQDEPESVILDAARDGYIKSVEEGVFFPPDEASTAQKQLTEGIDLTVSLAGLYRQSVAPEIHPALVEKRISMDVEGIDYPFAGTVDVYTTDNWLPDLKTAARKWPDKRAESSPQFTLYNELIKHETGRYPAKMSVEVFIKTKEPKHQRIETYRKPEDFDVLLKRIDTMIKSINAGIFPPAEPGAWSCSPVYCGYWWSCPHVPEYKKILPKRSAK